MLGKNMCSYWAMPETLFDFVQSVKLVLIIPLNQNLTKGQLLHL